MQRYVDFQPLPRKLPYSYSTSCDRPFNSRQSRGIAFICVVKVYNKSHPKVTFKTLQRYKLFLKVPIFFGEKSFRFNKNAVTQLRCDVVNIERLVV